jgi:hypothetical protein
VLLRVFVALTGQQSHLAIVASTLVIAALLDMENLNEDLVGVVRETMQPTHVSLWLADIQSCEDGYVGG